jgi:hypothetical protein
MILYIDGGKAALSSMGSNVIETYRQLTGASPSSPPV